MLFISPKFCKLFFWYKFTFLSQFDQFAHNKLNKKKIIGRLKIIMSFSISYYPDFANSKKFFALNSPKKTNETKNLIPKLNFEFLSNNENQSPQTSKPKAPRQIKQKNPRFNKPNSNYMESSSYIINNPPISSFEAKERFNVHLTSYEHKEILNYPEIYYIGPLSKKNKNVSKVGFDDSHSHYKSHIGDHIAYRYEIKDIFGKGAFGQVIKAYDHKLQINVALKIIINTEQMHEQGLIEIQILKHLKEKDFNNSHHIVNCYDSFLFREHLCVTFEILGLNLYEYSRSIRFQPMSLKQIQSISKNILQGLSFCHSQNIIHADMKPENVLLLSGSTSKCRIIDFGSSCFKGQQKYEYIQSRFYRAPEVILGLNYGPPMDIWSFACIIVEMMIGKPLFPGDDEHELLEMIMEIFGPPPRSMILACKRRKEFFDNELKPLFKNSRKRYRLPSSLNLRTVTKFSDPVFLDFLSKCFEWDPHLRINSNDALKHPWFSVVKTIQSARGSSVRGSYRLPFLGYK